MAASIDSLIPPLGDHLTFTLNSVHNLFLPRKLKFDELIENGREQLIKIAYLVSIDRFIEEKMKKSSDWKSHFYICLDPLLNWLLGSLSIGHIYILTNLPLVKYSNGYWLLIELRAFISKLSRIFTYAFPALEVKIVHTDDLSQSLWWEKYERDVNMDKMNSNFDKLTHGILEWYKKPYTPSVNLDGIPNQVELNLKNIILNIHLKDDYDIHINYQEFFQFDDINWKNIVKYDTYAKFLEQLKSKSDNYKTGNAVSSKNGIRLYPKDEPYIDRFKLMFRLYLELINNHFLKAVQVLMSHKTSKRVSSLNLFRPDNLKTHVYMTRTQIDTYDPKGKIEIREILKLKWQTSESYRLELAQYLLQQPRVLIDMKNDPIQPWKGMRFFHGCNSPGLQKGNDRCALLFDNDYTAFTTPYIAKALNYGEYVFTYRLTVDGSTLRILDLRSDYNMLNSESRTIWAGSKYDTFHIIHTLAGIEYGNQDRNPKAEDLFALFNDCGVDGALINNDVEWVWFDAGRVLEWEQPNQSTSYMAHILAGLNFDDVVKYYPQARDKNYTRQNAILEKGFDVPKRDYSIQLHFGMKRYTTIILEIFHKKYINASTLDSIIGAGYAKHTRVNVRELAHYRWSMDESVKPYTNQFLVAERHTQPSPLWTPAVGEKEELIDLYEIDSYKFWKSFRGDGFYTDITMMKAHREGNLNHVALPYKHLLEAIEELNKSRPIKVVFAIVLPNGFKQLVPPIETEKFESIELQRQPPSLVEQMNGLRIKNKRKADEEPQNDDNASSSKRTKRQIMKLGLKLAIL